MRISLPHPSWLPPLLVYFAAGFAAVSAAAMTWVVKERLSLSPSDLAAVAFWAGLIWSAKIPAGHLADRLGPRSGWLLLAGSVLSASSAALALGIFGAYPLPFAPNSAYWIAAILGPAGFMLQDAVADGMGARAVASRLPDGSPRDPAETAVEHGQVQLWGRALLISGSLFGGLLASWLLSSSGFGPEEGARLCLIAGFAPSLLALLGWLASRLFPSEPALAAPLDRRLLLGSLAFASGAALLGTLGGALGEELALAWSLGWLLFLLRGMATKLDEGARFLLWGSLLALFAFRAVPSGGEGVTWWMMDSLGFDPSFLSRLSVVGSFAALAFLFFLREKIASWSLERSVIVFSVVGAVLALPSLGMAFGLHEWSSAATSGAVGAREIALADTALGSPLVHAAMVPMLAWIARSAPRGLEATWFALLASVMNLALSASSVATKHLAAAFPVAKASASSAGDYSNVPALLLLPMLIGLSIPVWASLWSLRRAKSSPPRP